MDDEECESGEESGSESDSSRNIKPRASDPEADPVPCEGEIKVKKNPDVDTSFLPDREREEEERRIREELRQEWTNKQRKLKEESIQVRSFLFCEVFRKEYSNETDIL